MKVLQKNQSRIALAVALAAGFVIPHAIAQNRAATLVVGAEADFLGFNAVTLKAVNTNTMAPMMAVMEGLFAHSDNGIEPRLGLTLTESSDRMSADVKLRPGVKFHDGTPFNAEAVVFHYRRMLDPANGVAGAALLEPIVSVAAVDDQTVKFTLKHPWAALQSALALDDQVNLIGSPKALTDDPAGFHRKPIGTGPFVFKEWRTGDRVIMARNEAYWDPKLPLVAGVVFRIVPDNVSRIQSLKSGAIHVSLADSPEPVVDAQKNKDLQVIPFAGAGTMGWSLNHTKPPFNDIRARKAVIAAFDQQAFQSGFYLGTVQTSTGIFPVGSPWHCPATKWAGYDPAAVKRLIAETGPLNFTINSVNNPSARRIAEITQEFMNRAGINPAGIKVQLVDQTQHVRNFISGDYQVNLWRTADPGGDPDHVLTQIYSKVGARPTTRYDDPDVEKLLQQARIESDTAKRKEIYCRAEQMISDDAVFIRPIHFVSYILASPKLKGIPAPQNNVIRVRSMYLDN